MRQLMNKKILEVTERIKKRSQETRAAYLKKIRQQESTAPYRQFLSCGNLAHGFAACSSEEKEKLANFESPNIAIVSAYNDMLSAHQPYFDYPQQIKNVAQSLGASAQFAGGVPAMCDGVTQGRAGMELSLFSRDNIAMSTAIALSHDMFDGAVFLGICDKIVPGLLIGALSFGHLPGVFIPAGPMSSGIPNKEKAKVRQQYAQGKVDSKKLLETESQSYHSAGTCTFYGTANSNQMLMEIMGLQLPGSSFEHPLGQLRKPLTAEAVKQLVKNLQQKNNAKLSQIVSVKTIVNGVIGLLATGGSTNHTIHLIAIARAAGIILTWQDMDDLSKVIPLLCRIYPNGEADVNQFHQAGGIRLIIQELLDNGLLHNDVYTLLGDKGLEQYCLKPELIPSQVIAQTQDTSGKTQIEKPVDNIQWKKASHSTQTSPTNTNIISNISQPFAAQGGLTLLKGNIGKAIIKISAVDEKHQQISAPAKVFQTQQALIDAFKANQLNQDFIAVIIFQGPKANGMPELHKLTPILGTLQDQGFKVALVTDGRMSGASGKVPAAIHLCPEAKDGGAISLIRDGDPLLLDCIQGKLELLVESEILSQRRPTTQQIKNNQQGMGRELFKVFRNQVSSAEQGATIFDLDLNNAGENQDASN